jgi:hypothetical protein
MIHTILSSLFQIVMGLTLLYMVFSIFFADQIKEKMAANEAAKTKQSSLDKIAKVKVVSEDAKDIEKFITDNAQYLSDTTVAALVARIEMIRTDKVINDDTLLKKRIDALDPVEIDEEPVVVKRASRKR